jgi:hypothetical protein
VRFIVPIFRNRLPGETPAAPRTTPTARSPCRPAPARPAPTRSHALHANIKHQRGRGALWGALHAPPLPPGGIWAGGGWRRDDLGRNLRGLPVLVHEVSRRSVGSSTTPD